MNEGEGLATSTITPAEKVVGAGRDLGDLHGSDPLLEAAAQVICLSDVNQARRDLHLVGDGLRPAAVVSAVGVAVSKELGVAAGSLKQLVNDDCMFCGGLLVQLNASILVLAHLGGGVGLSLLEQARR